jgi:uncharacterized membrane protein YqjE
MDFKIDDEKTMRIPEYEEIKKSAVEKIEAGKYPFHFRVELVCPEGVFVGTLTMKPYGLKVVMEESCPYFVGLQGVKILSDEFQFFVRKLQPKCNKKSNLPRMVSVLLGIRTIMFPFLIIATLALCITVFGEYNRAVQIVSLVYIIIHFVVGEILAIYARRIQARNAQLTSTSCSNEKGPSES